MLINLSNLYSHVKGVVHVGGHHGQECQTYLQHGIQKVCVFEPVPSHFQIMEERLQDPRVHLFNVALGSERKKETMNISDFEGADAEKYKGMSSSILTPKKHLDQYEHIKFNETIEIDVHVLDDFAKENDINPSDYNFMNIDVQGYELEVFKGSDSFLKHLQFVYCEVNRDEVYENCPMVDDIDKFLESYGFNRVATDWAGDTWGDALYVKQ